MTHGKKHPKTAANGEKLSIWSRKALYQPNHLDFVSQLVLNEMSRQSQEDQTDSHRLKRSKGKVCGGDVRDEALCCQHVLSNERFR